MKALYYTELKGYQGIKAGELPRPEIGDNEVLLRVKAFSLNHLDIWVMSGSYPAAIPLPHIFGTDASGVVAETGKDVSHVKPGDEVVLYPGLSCGRCERCLSGRENECNGFSLVGVMQNGMSAEFAKVPAGNVFPKPPRLTFEEAACIGIVYTTAWNSLVQRARIGQADTVLLHAAGSGVGTALIQTAALFNTTIITTVGDDWKAAKARDLGAHFVINHRSEDFAEAVKRITKGELADIAVDHIGAATFAKSLSCLKRGGRLVTFGATSGDEAKIGLRYIFGKNLTVHGVYVGSKAAFHRCLELAAQGRFKPVVDSIFDFNDTPKAYEKLLSRQFFGKIVVRI